jgi:putative transposon-encoded protein
MGDDLFTETVPVETVLNAKNLQLVLKSMLTEAEIVTVQVKKGSKTSANIYVPRRHVGEMATVILWRAKAAPEATQNAESE